MYPAPGEYGLSAEGGELMASDYVLAIIHASLIGGILTTLVKKGVAARVIQLLSGIFLLITVLRPVVHLQLPDWSQWQMEYTLQAQQAVEEGEAYALSQKRQGISEQTQAYIQDKAQALGFAVQAQVQLSDRLLPYAVVLSGQAEANQRRELASYMEKELGISQERQIWQ